MKQYKRIGCALLAGILLCGVLSVAAPQRGKSPVRQADVPTVMLTADEPTEYRMKIAGRIQLQAAERTEPDEDDFTDSQGSMEDAWGSGSGSGGAGAEDAIRWYSDAPEIASVTEDGLVTALAEGTVEIDGACENGDILVCRLAVSGYAVTGITLTPQSDTMRVGETQTITAEIEPEQAQDAALAWSSGNTDVLTVSDDGVVTAAGEGEAEIFAEAESGYTASCTIIVSGYALERISIEPASVQMKIGESRQLEAIAEPEYAETGIITWKSDAPGIVTVDQDGLLKAVAAGSAIITAQTEDGDTATCEVTVTGGGAVTGITLSKKTLTLTAGDSSTLTATITPEELANTPVSWKSDNAAVARVDSNGRVSGVKAGTAIITASVEDVKATCTVTVKAKPTPTAPTTPSTPAKPTAPTTPSAPAMPAAPTTSTSTPTIPITGVTGGSGMLYLPSSLVPVDAVRQYTMPKYVPSAAFLTIDSGLDTNTESILTALAVYRVRATFFVPIDDLYASDDMLRHIAGEGHSIGLLLTKAQAADTANVAQLLNAANEKLSVITGTPTRLVRVAGGSAGAVSSDTLRTIQAAGYRLWDWNDAARETSLTAQQSYQSVVAALNQTGTVTVRFGGGANTAAVLQQLLPYMKYCGIPAKAIGAGDTPICQVS